MKAPQKFILSMLISILVFGAFTFWAYSGLFTTIETSFFRQRLEDSVQRQMKDTEQYFISAMKQVQSDLETYFQQDFVLSIFRVNQSANDTQLRAQALEKLRQQYPIGSVRIFDLAGQLHDSTRITDIKEQTPNRKEFLPSSELKSEIPLEKLLLPDGSPSALFLDPESNQFIYAIPIISAEKIRYGTAVVTLSTQSVSRINEKFARTSFGERFKLLDSSTIIIDMPAEEPPGLASGILAAMNQVSGDARFRVQADGSRAWFVYTLNSSFKNLKMLFLVDAHELEFPWYLRTILLVVVFLTVFLIAFLFLNIKQDDMVVLSDRIKRLQINVLKQYFERKDDLDSGRWQAELKLRREEVKATIKKGLGRRRRRDPEVDALIDKGWDEILDVLGAKKPVGAVMGTMDLSRLEDLVQRVISNYQTQIVQTPGNARVSGNASAGQTIPARLPPLPAVEEVEEIEEIQEAEELGEAEALEEIEEAESVDETDEPEELEDIEEAESIEEIEEPEALEEIEEVEALEDVEAVEELDEAESLEDVQEAEAIEEPEETEEIEALEELDDLEEVDEVDNTEKVLIPFYDDSIPSVVSYDLEPVADAAGVPIQGIKEEITEEVDTTDAQAVEEIVPAAARSGISFFGSYSHAGKGRTKIPSATSIIQDKARALEEADNLEELVLRCRGKLTLKSLYDYTGKPEFSEWAFDTAEEGVIRIPNRVFARRSSEKLDHALDALVSSVMHEATSPVTVATEEATSIEDLLRFDSSLETAYHDTVDTHHEKIAPEVTPMAQEQRSFYRTGYEKSQNLVITTKGLDFDSFLRDFRPDEGGKIKAMYTFSKRFRAETAMIVRIEMGGLRVQRLLGLSQDCGPWIAYKDGGECLMELNDSPSIAHFASTATVLSLVENPCSDFSLAKRQVWVPLLFEERLSYCIFGYTHDIEMKTFLSDYMDQLKIEKV